ncbi:MAG: hypothetical protein ABI615_12825 [Chthoniobacterales bacterium]
MKPTKRHLVIFAFSIVAIVCAYTIPELVALREAQPRTAIGFVDTTERRYAFDWLLIVGRRAERAAEGDATPHRNSRIALYHRQGLELTKETRDFAIRSTTTDERMPDVGELIQSGGEVTRGFLSVPFGLFSLEKGPWRYPGEIGFKISDWNRADGVITLTQAQILEKITAVNSGDTTFTATVVRSSYDKTGAWLHPTRTQTWSYRDSDGCMNLFKPVGLSGITSNAPDGPYEWDEFLKELSSRNLLIPTPMLLVAPWKDVASGDELKTMITVSHLSLPAAVLADLD